MVTPTSYTRGTSFTDAQAAAPAAPLSGPAVDNEFDKVKLSMDTTQQALALIQKADGTLADSSVGVDQIQPAVYTGLKPAVAWATATNYAVNDAVFYTNGSNVYLYRCLVAHASGVFSTDLANGDWLLLFNYTPPTIATTVAITAGGTGATTAAGARANLGLGAAATFDTLPVANGGTGGVNATAARFNLGLVIGTNVQAQNATLTSIAALGTAANKIAYTTGVDTWAEASATAAGLALLAGADAAAQRTSLGLGVAALANYYPVQQGTGVGQGGNLVKIGWATDASGLKLTVDSTDNGYIWTDSYALSKLANNVGLFAQTSISSAPISLTSGTYTAPSDGIAFAFIDGTDGAAAANTFAASASLAGATVSGAAFGMGVTGLIALPMAKGQTSTFSASFNSSGANPRTLAIRVVFIPKG